jgi:hypothetical protein
VHTLAILRILMQGAVLTFFSFIGFEDLLNVAEEVEHPERNLPIALVCAVVIATVIYLSVCVTALAVLSPTELAGSKAALVDVVGKAAPWFPPAAFTAIGIFAVANTALLNFVMGSRLLYGMSRQGLLPEGQVHMGAEGQHGNAGRFRPANRFQGGLATLQVGQEQVTRQQLRRQATHAQVDDRSLMPELPERPANSFGKKEIVHHRNHTRHERAPPCCFSVSIPFQLSRLEFPLAPRLWYLGT